MKEDKETFLKITADIILELMISVVFLGLSAAMIPVIYGFFSTTSDWLVVVTVFGGCVVTAVLMAWIFDQVKR